MKGSRLPVLGLTFGVFLALGTLLILEYARQVVVPLPVTNERARLALQSPGSMEFRHVPRLVLAFGLLALTPLVRWQAGRGVVCAGAAIGMAVFLRFSVDLGHRGAVSPWPWLMVVGLGLIALSAPFFRAGRVDGFGFWATGLAGVATPFLMPLLPSPQENFPTESPHLQLEAADRFEITGRSDLAGHDRVLWGSPTCPATQQLMAGWVSEGRSQRCRLTFRFVPVSRTPEERLAAALLKAFLAKGDPEWSSLLGPVTLDRLVRLGRKISPLEMGSYRREVSDDILLARKLAVREVPLVQDCPPDSKCAIE